MNKGWTNVDYDNTNANVSIVIIHVRCSGNGHFPYLAKWETWYMIKCARTWDSVYYDVIPSVPPTKKIKLHHWWGVNNTGWNPEANLPETSAYSAADFLTPTSLKCNSTLSLPRARVRVRWWTQSPTDTTETSPCPGVCPLPCSHHTTNTLREKQQPILNSCLRSLFFR